MRENTFFACVQHVFFQTCGNFYATCEIFLSNIFFPFFYRKSEFLGCLMIPVKMAMRKNINGSFLLQPQMSLNNPSPLIPEAEKKMLNATLDDDMKENHCYQNINWAVHSKENVFSKSVNWSGYTFSSIVKIPNCLLYLFVKQKLLKAVIK